MQLVLEHLDDDLSVCEYRIELLRVPDAVLYRLNLLAFLVLLLLLEHCHLPPLLLHLLL